MHAGEIAFGGVLERLGTSIDASQLRYFSRWITPKAELATRRFDARFFVARAPENQVAEADATEVLDGRWMRPADALEARIRGEISADLSDDQASRAHRAVPHGATSCSRSRTARPSSRSRPKCSPVRSSSSFRSSRTHGDAQPARRSAAREQPVADDAGWDERIRRARRTACAGRRSIPARSTIAQRDAFLAAARDLDASYVAILVTHGHPDHYPGAAPLAAATGAPVYAHPAARFPHDRALADGERIAFEDAEITALHAPGHARDHLVFVLEDERALFAGDIVLGTGTVVIAPPGGEMRTYQRTLHRLRDQYGDARAIYGGHGPEVRDVRAKLDEYIAHREARERQIVDALAGGSRDDPGARRAYLRRYGPAPVAGCGTPGSRISARARTRKPRTRGTHRARTDRSKKRRCSTPTSRSSGRAPKPT